MDKFREEHCQTNLLKGIEDNSQHLQSKLIFFQVLLNPRLFCTDQLPKLNQLFIQMYIQPVH